jgi:tetratricopeptide (TPR) repeat protein
MVMAEAARAEISPVPSGSPGIPRDAILHALKGTNLLKQQMYADAVREFDAALKLHPSFSSVLNNRAAALGYLGRLDDALRDLNRAFRLDANDAQVLFNRALIRVMLNDYKNAERDLNRSLELRKNAGAYNNRGSVRAHLEKHAEAIRDFDHSLKLDPDDPIARFNRSWSLLQLGQLDAALADVDAVLGSVDSDFQREQVLERRRQILDAFLWRLVDSGQAAWSGGKPKGSKSPVKITMGPPVSDYVIQDRR